MYGSFTFFICLCLVVFCCSGWRGLWDQWCMGVLPSLLACVRLCSAALVGEGCEMRGVSLPSLFACVWLCSAVLVGEVVRSGVYVFYLLYLLVLGCVLLLWLERVVRWGVYKSFTFFICLCLVVFCCSGWRGLWDQGCILTFFICLSLVVFCCSGWRGLWDQGCILTFFICLCLVVFCCSGWRGLWDEGCILTFFICLCLVVFCCSGWRGLWDEGCILTFFISLCLVVFCCSGWRGLWDQGCFDEWMFQQFMCRPSVSFILQQTSASYSKHHNQNPDEQWLTWKLGF